MSKQRKILGEILRFGMIGATATLLHYGLYLVFLLLIPAGIAYAVGYLLAFIFNFLATSYYTFRVMPSWQRLIGMSGAHFINFLLHMALLSFFLWLGISDVWAPVPVYAIALPVNFILVRYVFKRQK